jgi:hypothetical protein
MLVHRLILEGSQPPSSL